MEYRVDFPPVPTWLSALPFLFASRGGQDDDLIASSSVAAAAAALAADSERRDSRSRICFLLAETAVQYGRRTGAYSGPIPIRRSQLAQVAQISLPKVKRILGFLVLSGTIGVGEDGIRILDWKRLCRLGAYDRSWVRLTDPEDDEEAEEPAPEIDGRPVPRFTAAGDPASFV